MPAYTWHEAAAESKDECVIVSIHAVLMFSLSACEFRNMLQERNTVVVALHHSLVLVATLDFGSPAVKATEHTVIVSDEVICHVCQPLHN